MPDEHARLAPSSAHRWVKCNGSVIMQEKHPDTTEWNQPAEDGNAAHWVAEQCGKSQGLVPPAAYVGQTAPNGVIIDEDMADGVSLYLAHIASICDGQSFKPQFEVRLHMNSIYMTHNWGTCDALAGDPDSKTVHIWDFKYGRRLVEVRENWQMLDYAMGAAQFVHKLGHPLPERFEFHIVQPRAFHPDGTVRTWSVTYGELTEYAHTLRNAANAAMGDAPVCTAAGDVCRDCSASAACATLNEASLNVLEYVSHARSAPLSPDALAVQLEQMYEAQELIKARLAGLEIQAEQLIRDGTHVPGWRMVPGQSRLNWTEPFETVVSLGKEHDVELAKHATLTPTQAIKAGVPKESVEAISGRTSTGLKLVKEPKERVSEVFK